MSATRPVLKSRPRFQGRGYFLAKGAAARGAPPGFAGSFPLGPSRVVFDRPFAKDSACSQLRCSRTSDLSILHRYADVDRLRARWERGPEYPLWRKLHFPCAPRGAPRVAALRTRHACCAHPGA